MLLSVVCQESQSAVLAIDDYVKKVSSISRRWYSDSQLNPQLDRLVQASHQTLEIMGELHNSLKCDQLYRSHSEFDSEITEKTNLEMVVEFYSS